MRRLMAGVIVAGLAVGSVTGTACGSGPAATVRPSSVPRTYLLALLSRSIRAFEVGLDGRLRAAGGDTALELARARGPFVDPVRGLVHLIDVEGESLIAYRLDPTTGALTLFGQAQVPQRFGDAAVDPGGRSLYVASAGSIFGYRIDTSVGLRLEPIPGSPFTTPSAHGYPVARDFTFSPSGRFVWVHAEQATGSFGYPRRSHEALLSFRVVPESGALEPRGTLDIRVYDGTRSNLAVDSRDRFAFLGRIEEGHSDPPRTLTTLAIDPEDGELTEVVKLPGFADLLQTSPSGRWLLAADDGGDFKTLEIQPEGDLAVRDSESLEVAGSIAPHGPYVHVGSRWTAPDGHSLGARLLTLQLDEASGALATIQELELPETTILSLAVADLAPR